jgi:FtsP/CotA-like multicopper oxidase with cupredoxin domain
VSGPTLTFHEGRHAYLDLSNVGMVMRPDLFDPHTVHFHGFPNAASVYDGEPMASISINMGATLRYYYNIVEPGTYLYHCHVEATEHMQMGMIGNLFVYPKQNNLAPGTPLALHPQGQHSTGDRYAYNDEDGSTYYDVELPLQITGFDANFHRQHILVQPLPFAALYDDYPMLNGRGYPDTLQTTPIMTDVGLDAPQPTQPISSALTAQVGQKILLRMSNVSVADFHTFTIQGLKMKVVGKDARLLRGPTGLDLSYTTTSMTLGGGESADAVVDTTGAQPGTYFIYTTKLNHLSNETEDYGGIMTEITLTP